MKTGRRYRLVLGIACGLAVFVAGNVFLFTGSSVGRTMTNRVQPA